MAKIVPNRVIDEIRSRSDIVDVISSRVPLKKSGSSYKACCPFHKEKTPSFIVNPSRESFKCFGCGEGGDVFSFLMKYEGLTFIDAVKTLGNRCGVDVEFDDDDGESSARKRLYALHTELAEFYRRCLLRMKKSEEAREYLKSRDLPEEVLESFKIGYAPEYPGTLEKFAKKHKYTIDELVAAGLGVPLDRPRKGQNLYDRFRGRLMFPIFDTQGRVIAFSGRILHSSKKVAKYVNSPETAIFTKSHVLYGLDKAQRNIVSAPFREAIICEGQIDVMRCHACGFDRAVASQGTAFTNSHANLLKRYADSAVLVFDQDAAGQKSAIRTGAELLSVGISVRVAQMKKGDDPDSFLKNNSPDAFNKILSEAVGLVQFQVKYLRSQEPDPDSAGAAGRISGNVLNTVAVCLNEVHKARMLQEVAQLMNIPESALQSELAGIEEALRRQQEAAERRNQIRADAGDASALTQSSSPTSSQYAEPMIYVDDEVFFTESSHADLSEKRNNKIKNLPEKCDLAVCELLVHTFYDDKSVAEFLMELLPAWLIKGDICRKTVECFYSSLETGEDRIAELQEADEEFREFVGALAVAPDKTGGRENFTVLDLVRDLILKQWSRWCIDSRSRLNHNSSGDSSEENSRRRIDLMLKERELKRWSTGEEIVRTLVAVENEPDEDIEEQAQPRDNSLTARENANEFDAYSETQLSDLENLTPADEVYAEDFYDDY
jgi:DNA primase